MNRQLPVGSRVIIDGKHNGIIVANLNIGIFSESYPEEQWSYLAEGLLIDTDFAGLVHYDNTALQLESIVLAP
ncbi:MAG: hypothetical protein EP312_03165 [Gammaproteobacteria bacterium]|nr:MAG: hypothetical protein EP312_03165 [Gammaproteobacteria bacterium]